MSLRREDLLHILQKCAEKHGVGASLKEVMDDVSALEPKTIAIRAESISNRMQSWRTPDI
ncbi:MAG: hypothetical protein ABIG39_05490 [Candidatus Micrarchaeota archaeon]